MKIGLYSGSFNPWHKGHEDVLKKALQVFDKVYVIELNNPEKLNPCKKLFNNMELEKIGNVKYIQSDTTLKEQADNFKKCYPNSQIAIIRGLRNGDDLQYEMNQQYWNEDVGIEIPFVYFITDRSLSHVSSSSIRTVNNLGLEHDY